MILTHPQLQQSTAPAGKELELLPNLPNPFVEMTLLRFRLPQNAKVMLSVFDATGRVVKQKSGVFDSGENHLVLQRADLEEPGIYEYQLETASGAIARRKLVMF